MHNSHRSASASYLILCRASNAIALLPPLQGILLPPVGQNQPHLMLNILIICWGSRSRLNPDSVGSEYWPRVRDGVNGSQKRWTFRVAGGFIGGLEAYPGAGMLMTGTLAEVVALLIPKMWTFSHVKFFQFWLLITGGFCMGPEPDSEKSLELTQQWIGVDFEF